MISTNTFTVIGLGTVIVVGHGFLRLIDQGIYLWLKKWRNGNGNRRSDEVWVTTMLATLKNIEVNTNNHRKDIERFRDVIQRCHTLNEIKDHELRKE